MKNKVMEFPKTRSRLAKISPDAAMVVFTTGERRFAVQWIITEIPPKKATVIPFQKIPRTTSASTEDRITKSST